MNNKKTPLSLSWLNDKSRKYEIEYSYYRYYIDRQINQIEREEKEESLEEAIIDFLNQPGWSLLRWNELDIKEDDTEESNRRINFRVAIGRRGKKRQKNLDKEGYHGCGSFDNVHRKIQVHYHNFIIALCNDALKTEYENSDYSFKQIKYYKVKEEIKYSYLKNLKHCSIEDILNFDISSKYLSLDRNHNKKLLEKIESSSIWLYNLFQMNYLQLFKYYYNDGKPLNKIYFMEREIFLTPKTKSFYCLLEKNQNLKSEIIEIAKRCYLKEDNNNNNNTKLIQFSHKNISSN